MALSTVVSNARATARAARLGDNAHQGALALDWANGVVVQPAAASVQSPVFDAVNDRIVVVATDTNMWISVGPNPTAAAGTAGNLPILTTMPPTPIYVPAGCKIAAIAASGNLSAIPALFLV